MNFRMLFSFFVCVVTFRTVDAESRHSGISPTPGSAIVLVDADHATAPIVFPADQPQAKQAAAELAKYLSSISGKPFATTPQTNDGLPDRAVVVGVPFDAPLDLSREGFVIQTTGERLYIAGGSPRATLYAVFSLLEDQLGCRWWSHTEEDVPSKASIAIASQNTHIEPAFRIHDLFNREGQSTKNFFAYKRRGKSGTSYTGVHNLCPMLKPYAEKHPEFLPTAKRGERKFNNLHMNYTAAGMPEIVADELSKQVERYQGNVDDYLYFAGMGDWYGGMDYSTESKRIYAEETWTDPDGRVKPGYSATLLRMINRAAELLEKKHPGAMVSTHAYMSLEAPPAKTRPRSNVAIEIPRLRHDTVRSILESQHNESFRRNLDRWCELAPGRVYIWEYGANFSNFIKPFPCLRSISENIKYYHQVGVAGIRIQGNYVSMGSDLVVLKNYVWGKLLWDPTRDVDELVNEFCRGYYGPAAGEMIEYVNLLEGSVRGDELVKADEFEKDFTKWLRPEIVKPAERLMSVALSKTKNDEVYHRRVKEARVSLEAFHLWNPGRFVEQGEKLIRADFNSDTMARAVDLIKHCRSASPREWGDGRAYRMGFLSMHGGPMPILKSGPLTVKIAPLQAGKIRSVMLGDVIAIDETRDLPDPGARLYEIARRESNRVVMTAELGIANWGSNTKQIATRSIAVGDGKISTTSSLQLVPRNRQNKNTPALETIYRCDDPKQLEIQHFTASNSWQTIALSATNPKVEIPNSTQWRIIRHDRGVTIHDDFDSPHELTTTCEFNPNAKGESGFVRMTTRLTEVTVVAESVEYLHREIRITPLPKK